MKRCFLQSIFLLGLPLFCFAQKISYSVPGKDDNREINFEIIGKMNGNLLVYKSMRSYYSIDIYDKDMQLKEKVDLDFISNDAFNTGVIAYPDFFYLVYQFQKRTTLHCMAVKMDANGHPVNDPVELDTTQVGVLGDNKLYSIIVSEDKQHIMVLKIHRKNDNVNLVTFLYDNQLQLLKKSRQAFPYNDGKNTYSDFLLDNEGDLVFARSIRTGSREDVNDLSLIRKQAQADSFIITKLDLRGHYIDPVNLKVDNVGKRYLLNTFYYKQNKDNIEGLYCNIWDKQGDSSFASHFEALDDSIRAVARSEGSLKAAFNDFFIRNIVVKKDGGYILIAEKYSIETRSNDIYNRRNYYNNSPYYSPLDYYKYSPSSNWYYPGYNAINSNQGTRYMYDNIMLLGFDRNGEMTRTNMLLKEQYDDGNDNYLSFLSFNTGGEIHFLFNRVEKNSWMIEDNSLLPGGEIRRNPILKSLDKGYEFMPKYGKQVGVKQVVVPCTYRNLICFARIDY